MVLNFPSFSCDNGSAVDPPAQSFRAGGVQLSGYYVRPPLGIHFRVCSALREPIPKGIQRGPYTCDFTRKHTNITAESTCTRKKCSSVFSMRKGRWCYIAT